MPDRILAILPSDYDLGFKLTGIDTESCAQAIQAKAILEKEVSQRNYSIILIDESFLLSFDARFTKKIQETSLPLIMGIPLKKSFKKEIEAEDYFSKMVRSAIGYEIRIR